VLAEELERWSSASAPPTPAESALVPVTPAPSFAPLEQKHRWRRIVRRRVGAALSVAPPLKRLAVSIYLRTNKPKPTEDLPVVQPVVSNIARAFPLSKRLTEGLAAVMARTTIRELELEAFLESFFGGKVPRLPDEIFLDIIGTRF
jgi:hypothetical protein